MRRHWLKYTRAALAIVVLALLTAAFVDFRGLVDEGLAHALASVQFVPAALSLATGASLSVAAVAILAATLAFGRVYCSVLCPLGLFQDAVARVASWMRRKPHLLRYTKPATWVRQGFLWGTVAGLAAGWAGLTLALLDPYSIFGRFGSMLFRPVVTTVNNWLVGPANAAGLDALYRVPPQWAAAGALAVPAAMLLLVALLAARHGRLYCNTVCPVGTLLGLASGNSAWRLAIDQDRCRKCGDCLRVCKAQCIDLRSGTIDNSRCVACYNCVSACDESGIHHRFSWKPETGDRRPDTDHRPATAYRPPPPRPWPFRHRPPAIPPHPSRTPPAAPSSPAPPPRSPPPPVSAHCSPPRRPARPAPNRSTTASHPSRRAASAAHPSARPAPAVSPASSTAAPPASSA